MQETPEDELNEQQDVANTHLRYAFRFYGINLFLCLVVKYTHWFDSYDQMFWMELAVAAITAVFAWMEKDRILPLLTVKRLKPLLLAGIIVLAVLFSVLVSFVIRQLNISFFNADTSYYNSYKLYIAPQLVMIYSIALMPAVFEELAFRGILFNHLSFVLSDRLVILFTSFMFAALHLNLISFMWLVPFGLLLGYLRMKYDTIWYGIIFHFVFNITACLIDLYQQGHLF